MSFKSDNVAPIYPHILKAIVDANEGIHSAYGHDDYSKKLKDKVSQIFQKDVEVFLVSTGSISNKMRYMVAQIIAYFDVWMENAAHANLKAQELAKVLIYRYKLAYPVETNQVFIHMTDSQALKLQEKGVHFYHWEDDIYRFVTHFMTTEQDIFNLS